ncbi:MAG: hypothetical protein Q8S33_36945 [Myxococcales bacterium]|nr:hypothetical protein [Myxococcales bacterium]
MKIVRQPIQRLPVQAGGAGGLVRGPRVSIDLDGNVRRGDSSRVPGPVGGPIQAGGRGGLVRGPRATIDLGGNLTRGVERLPFQIGGPGTERLLRNKGPQRLIRGIFERIKQPGVFKNPKVVGFIKKLIGGARNKQELGDTMKSIGDSLKRIRIPANEVSGVRRAFLELAAKRQAELG